MQLKQFDYAQLCDIVKSYYEYRGLKMPNDTDAMIWASTEAAECLDCVMRMEDGWVRNDPNKAIRLDYEIGDVLMMLLVASFQSWTSFEFNSSDIYTEFVGKYKPKYLCICLQESVASDARRVMQGKGIAFNMLLRDLYEFAVTANIDPIQGMLDKFASKGFKAEYNG